VLLALALLVLAGLVVAALATFTRRPLLTAATLLIGLTAVFVQAGASDGRLTLAVTLLLVVASLTLKAVGEVAGAVRPRRVRGERTREERETAARTRQRRRLAA
jgi:hypothetical protein